MLCCKISSNGQCLHPVHVNGSRVNNCLRKTTPVNGTCFIDNILSHLSPIPNLATAIVLIELIQLVKMPHVLMSNYASAYQVCFKKWIILIIAIIFLEQQNRQILWQQSDFKRKDGIPNLFRCGKRLIQPPSLDNWFQHWSPSGRLYRLTCCLSTNQFAT